MTCGAITRYAGRGNAARDAQRDSCRNGLNVGVVGAVGGASPGIARSIGAGADGSQVSFSAGRPGLVGECPRPGRIACRRNAMVFFVPTAALGSSGDASMTTGSLATRLIPSNACPVHACKRPA